MTPGTRLRKPLPTAETLLEGRFERDRAVHAAVEAGRPVGSVAREFGLTGAEVSEIHAAVEMPCVMLANTRYRARKRAEAAELRAANADRWPPARIRNILVQEFGIPSDRLEDAGLIAEVVSRSEILSLPMTHSKTADRIAAFLESQGHALRG